MKGKILKILLIVCLLIFTNSNIIAEAFYGDIPKEMWEPTKKLFPPIFDRIIESMIMRTAYGATGEQYD